jgi:hypothetical protein
MDLTKYRRLNESIALETIKNNTLNAAYNDSSIIITSRYFEYIAFLFTTILLIMLFFRFASNNGMQSGGSGCNYSIIIIKVALVIIFIIFYINRKKINNYI